MKLPFLLFGLLSFTATAAAQDEQMMMPEPRAPKPKEIRIGYLADLSGPAVSIGVQSIAGAELAVDELKAKGINVKLLIDDQRNDPKTAVAAATKLLQVDSAQAIACDLTPPSTAVAPLMSRFNKLFLYQAPALSPIGAYPYAFRNFLDYEQGCEMVAAHWKKMGVKKVGHLKMNYEFGELCLKGSQKIFPQQAVIDYNSGDDLRSGISRLQSQGIEAILQTAYEPDVLNALRIFGDLRYSPYVGIPTLYLTNSVKMAGGSRLDRYTAFGFPQVQEEFIQKLHQRNTNTSLVNIQSAAIGYQHVMLAAQAITACGEDIQCQRDYVAKAPADPVMGFMGWKDRLAQYQYHLYKLDTGDFVAIN